MKQLKKILYFIDEEPDRVLLERSVEIGTTFGAELVLASSAPTIRRVPSSSPANLGKKRRASCRIPWHASQTSRTCRPGDPSV